MKKKILIFSAGSSGREINQLIKSINSYKPTWNVLGYVDDKLSKKKKKLDNLKIFSNKNKPKLNDIFAISGIMNSEKRKKIYENEIKKSNYKIANLIHPKIEIPECIKIGEGNIIFNNVHLSYDVKIKNYSIISNFSDIGHNFVGENYITIMPSAVIGGNCEIGEGTLISAGAKIHPKIRIGKNCSIGIGTNIIENIKNNTNLIEFQRQTKIQKSAKN